MSRALSAACQCPAQCSNGQMGLPCQFAQCCELLILILLLFSRCLRYSFCHHCIHDAQKGKCACHKRKNIDEPGRCRLCRIKHRRAVKLFCIGPVHCPGKDSTHQDEKPVLPDSFVGTVLAIALKCCPGK